MERFMVIALVIGVILMLLYFGVGLVAIIASLIKWLV